MKIAIFGNKTSTEKLIHYLVENHIQIQALIVYQAKSEDVINISGFSSALNKTATKNKIPLIEVDEYALNSDESQEKIIGGNFDLGIVTGWQRLIPTSVLQSFSIGVFGWHGSFLQFPNGRGRSPLNWSIRLGQNEIYHNLFKYDGGADTGDVYETVRFSIEPCDYIADLQSKALAHIKSSSLRLIKDCISSRPLNLSKQANGVAINFPKITPYDGRLQPNRHSAREALNIIRSASHPFPGAFLESDGCKIIVWRASLDERPDINSKPIMFCDGVVYFTSYEVEPIR